MPEVIFNGPDGRLEGRYHHSRLPNAPVALVLHPDPRYGGTMHNKVVYALFQLFKQRGFSVMRFNFRGVGRSQGRFDNGQGELSDAASALDWLQAHNPDSRGCWIGGFSFGAWISMQLLMRRPEISGFVSVAPPANMYDFGFLAPCPSNGLIIHGSADTVVPQADVAKLAEKLANQRGITVKYRLIDAADHFFEAQVEELTDQVADYLDNELAPMER